MMVDENLHFWNKMSAVKTWSLLTSPWRPSPEDINNYLAGIKTGKRDLNNVLILGATPELRDLAARCSKKTWIIDYSKNMISEMSKFLKLARLQKEKWVIADWCRYKNFKKNFFDVILGDLVLRLIPFNKQTAFLRKIASILKPDGLFVSRHHFVNEPLINRSPEKIIGSTIKLLNRDNFFSKRQVMALLVSRLLDKNWNLLSEKKIRESSRSDIHQYLEKYRLCLDFEKRRVFKNVLEWLDKYHSASFFIYKQKEVEDNLNKFFHTTKKLIAKDYEDSAFYPVYVLKPKLSNNYEEN